MIKQYFKQAWHLITQNKLFSAIYIAGTALGISMVMVMAILNYVKTSNIYPETNRDRMLYVRSLFVERKGKDSWLASGGFSHKAVKEFFYPLKTPEFISVESEPQVNYVSFPNQDEMIEVHSRLVDINYWKVFDFHFVDGKPFSDADFQSGLSVAVVSASLAKELFGTEKAVGKEFEYGFKPYQVVGVVRDVSYVMSDTYARIWIPYTSSRGYDNADADIDGLMGNIAKIYFLAKSTSDFDNIRREVNDKISRYNAQSKHFTINIMGQPDSKSVAIHRIWTNQQPDMKKIRLKAMLIVLFLLLVPAINLSGMNSTRMERRMAEMGVRKAFGASRSLLLKQVLIENFLLTGLGGFVGLLLSYLIILFTRNWILDIDTKFATMTPHDISVDFSFSMLFNIKIFFYILLACLAMNVLSALLPVYRSLRKNIVDSLYIKYN